MNPEIVTIHGTHPECNFDPHWVEESLERNADRITKTIPARYVDAVVSVPEVADWVRAVVTAAVEESRTDCVSVQTGPSLLILGPTGVGKSYQAYGAIRALAVSGARCIWSIATAADIYAAMRPRPKVDSEEVFERYATAQLLVVDDLGAARGSEWTEEVNYRLINHRYEHRLPTLITSNVLPRELGDALGERVTSRLVEMASRVVMKGNDRRKGMTAA
jgi:DNA replication protein DnaC